MSRMCEIPGSEDSSEIGYIKLTTFNQNAAGSVKEAIKKLRENNVKAFVLDLRNNSGVLFPVGRRDGRGLLRSLSCHRRRSARRGGGGGRSRSTRRRHPLNGESMHTLSDDLPGTPSLATVRTTHSVHHRPPAVAGPPPLSVLFDARSTLLHFVQVHISLSPPLSLSHGTRFPLIFQNGSGLEAT